ncbi:MAG TPA: class I SAM-dependent methyltransferase [Jatrophihabitans sp.]|uniref:class I SAM-dependent methyltransferase n=1 Tax=Jatrophihabitans sp. TaxID=1932789 RepID=UPI002F1EDD99
MLAALLGLFSRPPAELDAVDVGAGTGIWTRCLADAGFRSVTAVEPNADMRRAGIRDSVGRSIVWREGSGEHTGLPDVSADVLCMASSFHWVDLGLGLREFHRVLRPDGWFVALWSTRLLECTPVLQALEDELRNLQPDLRRSAFGPASRTDGLTDRLADASGFDDVIALEGRHTTLQSPDHYLGNWRSTNDVRHRMGEAKFAAFLQRAETRLAGFDSLEVTYATRAWAVRRTAAD